MTLLIRLSLLLFFLSPANTASASETYSFDLPAQPLAATLNNLASTSGTKLIYADEVVRNLQAVPLKGSFTLEQALNQVLNKNKLSYELVDNSMIVINQKKTDPQHLPEITVTSPMGSNSPYNTSYTHPNATTATKTDASVFNTPVTVQTVSKAIMNDQQAINLGSVLQNVSGVSQGFNFGVNANETFQIRGFENDSIFRDGILTPNNNAISLANAQRIEVLKGPAGMLFGRTQPGGLVNVVTKRPQRESYYSLQQQFGSFGTYRTLLDVTGALNKDGTLLYRVNYEHLDSNSFRNFVYDKRDFIAPSLTWHITQNTQLDLDFMYQNRKSTTDSGIPYDLQRSGAIPGKISRSFRGNEPTDFNNSQFYEGDATLTHRINENWKLRGRFSMINSNITTAQTSSNGNTNLIGDLDRGFLRTADHFESKFGTVDLTGHFATGPLKHALLLGTDYYHSTNANRFSPFRSGADGVPTINVFNPVYGFTGFLNDPLGAVNKTRNEWVGVYVQDQISLWDKWQLLLGSRFDHAGFGVSDNPSKQVNEFSPRVALLYRPLSWLGIYANYAHTFNAVNRGTTVSGVLPDPEKSREYEAGLKGEWMDGKLFANLAFFDLTKTNVQTPLPAPFVNKVAITGEQRSRGIELDLRGQLTDYWNIIATYAYIHTEVLKDSAPLDTVIGSSGAGNTGHRFANVPRNSGSVWTTYDFSGVGVRGFSAGAGVFVASKRAGNIDNSFYMPGYARVDMMLKYQRKIGPSTVTAQFNIQNLLDKEYIASSNGFASFIHQTLPGAPRTFLGSVMVQF
ncbi:MAG: TonB-dependent receptor [Nitrosomonas oligotropha]|uniref:TonB-dependent receptor n=1 Tax=Nitrosomonas oligotropha TaxID=42354 RepID=A0A5C7VZ73_9PROT|nr:MAG: TonB-dependent receptor [Nitrosomonas oligotropha]